MILTDVNYLLGQFFKFYFNLFAFCGFVYSAVLMFRKVLSL